MTRFQDRPIRAKLLFIVVATTAAALPAPGFGPPASGHSDRRLASLMVLLADSKMLARR